MAKLTQQSVSGTSFHNVTIKATVNELMEILGEPSDMDNSGQDKVNVEWECETENGKPFTIYDWKEYRPIGYDELIEWHIGAHNKSTAQNAYHEVQGMLNDYLKDLVQ